MRSLDSRVTTHLILDMGFSRHNAEKALQMFRADELSSAEKVVIEYIMLNPEPSQEDVRLHKLKGSFPVMWVADHLNFRLTHNGGQAKTPSRLK